MISIRLRARDISLALGAALFIVQASVAQWSADPSANLPVVIRPGEQVLPKVASTSGGGCFVGWFDHASGNYDVFLQYFDASGVARWAPGGLAVSTHPQDTWLADWDLCVDASDNAILVFTDIRAGGDWDVYAYKVSPAGAQLWGANGLSLSANADFDVSPRVALASDGDLVFVWSTQPSGADGKIVMQRVSPGGALRLAAGGIAIAGDPGEDPGFCRIIPAQSGAVIVAWIRDISSFMSPRHIRAQKYSPAGAALWSAPVAVFDATSVPIAHAPGLVADDAGGAVLCWHRWSGGLFNSFVQHLDAGGNELFAHNGVAVSTSSASNVLDPTVSYVAASGDIVVFWNERNAAQSQWGIGAQKITPAGARAFGGAGVALRPVDGIHKNYPRSVPFADGAIAFWAESFPAGGQAEKIVGVRLDGLGSALWAGSVLEVSTAPSAKARYPLSIDAAGMVKIVWEDDRNGNPDLYAQNVNAGGTLGTPSLAVDTWRISLASGGRANMFLDAGAAQAGRLYLVLGSVSGLAPGLNLGGYNLPLVVDPYFELTLNAPALSLFSGFLGNLDGSARASAALTLPPGLDPSLAGLTLHHAFVVLDSASSPSFTSNAVSVTLGR